MQTKVISTSLLCMRWKIKSQLQSSLTCVSYCPSHQWLVRNVFYIHVYISTLHQGHSANFSHNCITSVTWLSRGKLYTCGSSRMVFFLSLAFNMWGYKREKKSWCSYTFCQWYEWQAFELRHDQSPEHCKIPIFHHTNIYP